MVRHVCVALKRYMESHLFYKYTQLSRLNEPSASAANAAPLFRVSQIKAKHAVDRILKYAILPDFQFNCRRRNSLWK